MPSNASSRTVVRIFECVAEDRWDEVESLHHPRFWCEDRRLGLGGRATLRGQLANLRAIRSLGPGRFDEECIDVSGDTVSLCRYMFRGTGDSPGFEVEFLSVNEVDDSGRLMSYVTFDPSDMDEALAEFKARMPKPDG